MSDVTTWPLCGTFARAADDKPTRQRAPAGARAYLLTVKALVPLVPAAVVTLTLSLPNLAFDGTLHLMRVALQETYLAQARVPNLTTLLPRFLPKYLPVIVTTAPRLDLAGESFARLDFGTLDLVRLATNLVA